MMITEVLNLAALSEQLHRGNAGVPRFCRRSFYEAKSFILKAFGTPDGEGRDIQGLVDECFGCHGTGLWGRYQLDCNRCGGSGVYRSKLIWLDRFRFGDHVFHVPVDGITFGPAAQPTIIGRIKHEPYPDSTRCAVDIAWLFASSSLFAEVTFENPAFAESAVVGVDGLGADYVRAWAQAKRLSDDREWKAACEARREDVPF